jgi:hypothetical protein
VQGEPAVSHTLPFRPPCMLHCMCRS